MKIAIVYVYAIAAGPRYDEYAFRFVESYHKYPAGMDHQTVIVINGIRMCSDHLCLFSSLPNCVLLEHDNTGYDIGAFQMAAQKVPCDLMVFFGASTFFTRRDWLKRMVQSYEKHGLALYGAMGNKGALNLGVYPHIRTTAFWIPPKLFNAYPVRVTQPAQRHPFEHGSNNLTAWITRQGLKAWVVNWSRETEWAGWDLSPNGFHRGDQSDVIAFDHLCERPYYPR